MSWCKLAHHNNKILNEPIEKKDESSQMLNVHELARSINSPTYKLVHHSNKILNQPVEKKDDESLGSLQITLCKIFQLIN